MIREIQGQLRADGQRYAIVVSRFNELITSKLLSGAVDTLKRHGCEEEGLTCVHVPGAFELPFVAGKLAMSGSYDAVICVGCVIRGQHPILITSRVKQPEGSPGSGWTPACQPRSGSLQQTRWNKPSSGPGPRRATRARTPR